MKTARRNSFIRHLTGLVVIGAATLVGAWSGVSFCYWLDPMPELGSVDAAKLLRKSSPEATKVESSVAVRTPRSGVRSRRRLVDVWTGPRRTGAFRVTGVSEDGQVDTQCVDSSGARRGLDKTLLKALRKRGKAPLDERYARRTSDPYDTPEARRLSLNTDEEDDGIYPGDVYISGLPMVDQGRRAYCAVASAARVLQGYGIEVTMEDLASMAHTSSKYGTDAKIWERVIGRVANEHGLELKVIPELTDTATPLSNLIYDYNQTARDMDYPELSTWKYVSEYFNDYKSYQEDRLYNVHRELVLTSDQKSESFNYNVTTLIDDSDPILWTVRLGDVAEQVSHGNDTYLSTDRGSHMRILIGYNEDRGEILYTDSWGEGHELKRMDAADALSITTAMYYFAE